VARVHEHLRLHSGITTRDRVRLIHTGNVKDHGGTGIIRKRSCKAQYAAGIQAQQISAMVLWRLLGDGFPRYPRWPWSVEQQKGCH
jgi:hypothetical protein